MNCQLTIIYIDKTETKFFMVFKKENEKQNMSSGENVIVIVSLSF